MEGNKKILIATPLYPPDIGGPATYTKLLEKELPKYNFEVAVVSFGTVRHLPKVIRHFVYFLKVIKAGNSAEIIYAQDPVSVGLPAWLAAKLTRKKFGVRVAGDYAWEQGVQRFGVKDGIDEFQNRKYGFRVENLKKVQSLVAKKADFVVTPSRYFKQLVSGWGKGIRVEAIYNGVDLTKFSGIKPDLNSSTILSAGRLVPWKGFPVLIESIAKLPGWNLVILGDGPDRKKLEHMVKDLNLQNRVKLYGAVSQDEMVRLLKQTAIFALNTSFESFSFQTVEAMASGLPVIVTNIGSLPELVEDGKQGYLIDVDDREGFIKCVRKIDGNPTVKQSMSWEARKKAQKFSINITVENMAKLLKKYV